MVLLKKYIHLLLLLCILIFSFKIRYISPTSLADLTPPDSSEYSLSAYNLYHYHIIGIKFYGQYYPLKYPYGYPLLIIPFYIIFGNQPYNAVYCTLFFALLSIVFAYLIGKKLGNRFTGLIAALFVSLCPTHISFSKFVMTETSSTFLAIFICWLLLKVTHLNLRIQNFLLLLFLGLITGFSVSVHLTNFLFIPPVLISLLLGGKSNPRSIFTKEAIVLVGIILALAPLLHYQFHTFGSPLKTGYEVREPDRYGQKIKSFSFKFFAHPHHGFKMGNFIVFLLVFLGMTKTFYPATMFPLLLGGFLFILSERRQPNKKMIFLIFSSILVCSLFAFFSFYAVQQGRHLLQGIPLLMVLAAYGLTLSIDKGIFKSLTKRSIFSLIMLGLFLMTIIQMGIWSYSQPKSSGWIVNRQYKMIEEIKKHIPNNCIIISQLNPIIAEQYFTEHTAGKIVHVSLSVTPHWARIEKGQIKPIRYDRAKKYSFLFLRDRTINPRTHNYIRQSLKKDVPVYLFRFPASERLFPHIQRLFKTVEKKEDSRLFRLYLKDW